jgi:hypothetical protein
VLQSILTHIPLFVYPAIYIAFILFKVVPYFIQLKFNDKKVDLNGLVQTTGVIKGYKIDVDTHTIKNEKGEKEDVETKYYQPIISYIVNGEPYEFLYKKSYKENFNPKKEGTEVPIYVNPENPQIVKALFVDIYNREMEVTRKQNKIIAIGLGVICMGLFIVSLCLR